MFQVQPDGIEKEMTLRMMDKYGWWNLRGGCWCRVDIQSCPPAFLEWQRLKLPAPLRQNQPLSSRKMRNGCSRCGRDSDGVNTRNVQNVNNLLGLVRLSLALYGLVMPGKLREQ